MENTYDVRYKNKCVGQVLVKKDGLYCCITCSAKVHKVSMYRLWAIGENYSHDFGLCIPREDGIELVTRIPVKHFTQGPVSFELRDGKERENLFFVPVSAEKPFPYLSRLEYARLTYQDGIMGVCFQDDSSF